MTLKAPFPYFGGKTRVVEPVWSALGDVRNYVEPFAGSAAMLLGRPAPHQGPETLNDYSCLLVNAWRAIASEPEALAALLVSPVAEVNTEAQHNALMRAEPQLREELGDPGFWDAEKAAWWIKGANEWIGTGWATGEGPWSWTRETGWVNLRKLPHLGDAGTGINRKLPHLGDAGKGINRKLPHLGDAGTGEYAQRVEAVTRWLCALRDRLCSVRIACGDWSRVLGPSITIKHSGITGVFLDPPYESTEYVYGDRQNVSTAVNAWCGENGNNPKMHVVLAGRGTEHDNLGWRKQSWSALRGYSSTELRHTEALWFSPHCLSSAPSPSDLI